MLLFLQSGLGLRPSPWRPEPDGEGRVKSFMGSQVLMWLSGPTKAFVDGSRIKMHKLWSTIRGVVGHRVCDPDAEPDLAGPGWLGGFSPALTSSSL